MHCILSSLALCTLPFVGAEPHPTVVLEAVPQVGGVEWEHGSLDAAVAKAKDRGTMCLAYFWVDGSEQSGKLYQDTLSHESAQSPLGKMVCYSAKHSDATAPLFEKFKIKTVPTMLFLDGNGVAQDGIAGFIPLDKFVAECERIQAGKGTLRDLQYRLSQVDHESPEGIKARWLVAGKLLDLQDVAGHDLHMDKIRALDPDGKTVIGAQLVVGDLANKIVKASKGEKGKDGQQAEGAEEGEESRVKFDLAPLYGLAQASKSRPLRYEAWMQICRLEVYNQNLPKAAVALQETEKNLAPEDARAWYLQSTGWMARYEEHMTSKDRKMALRFAGTGYKLAKKAHGETAETGADSATKDGGAVTDAVLAKHCEALAIALHINRKQKKAVHFAKQAIELDPENKQFTKTLKRVSAEG